VISVRISFVEWPENLSADSKIWDRLKRSVAAARPDILLTNELPFGSWIARRARFSRKDADASIAVHDAGLARLIDLQVPAIISSRPVWNGTRLANEAFVLQSRTILPLHRKQYFPNEPGWFESNWYRGDDSGYSVTKIRGIKVGVLLCTEAMFNEHARAYGKAGASLIVIPRASGMRTETWKIAGAMASLVSGAYVVSSNRVGHSQTSPRFGGQGFAYAPQARLLSETNAKNPIQTIELNPATSKSARREYPCYVHSPSPKIGYGELVRQLRFSAKANARRSTK
jgi:N-carbamoylputrescine amidase